MCVHVYVCQHSESKTTGIIISKLGRWIVHTESKSPILFEVRRTNVKVGVSLLSPECQSSSLCVFFSTRASLFVLWLVF